MLGPVGGEEQGLGAHVQGAGLETLAQEPADVPGRGLPGEVGVESLLLDPLVKEPALGALAGTVDALQGDEHGIRLVVCSY